MTDELQVVHGTLDLLVLKALVWGPRHGYAVAHWISQSTGEDLQVEDRALYVALHRLERHGWVESEWGLSENNRRAKYYQITPSGRSHLAVLTGRWMRYTASVSRLLQTS